MPAISGSVIPSARLGPCADKLTTSRRFLVRPDGRRKRGPQTLPSLERTGGGRFLCPLQQQGRELVGHVEHHIMPACKLLLPPAALSCLGVKLPAPWSRPPSARFPLYPDSLVRVPTL